MKASPLDLVTSEIVGPSSSHTAGVMRIGRRIHDAMNGLGHVHIFLYNSLADTGDAHMTKSALVAGLLGWKDTDPRTPFSFGFAEEEKLKIIWHHRRDDSMHPNTVYAKVLKDGTEHIFTGKSIGGGRIQFSRVKELPRTAVRQ